MIRENYFQMGSYQPNEPIEIVADDRERESDVIDCLRSITAVSVRIDRLPLGDYLANRRLLFERKTLHDFTRSIRDSPGSDMNALSGFMKSSGVLKKRTNNKRLRSRSMYERMVV